ncbi:MAG: glutamate-5-semialdehyde dehydrogenase [Desulfovibrio sp.]|jgi:glutamate-5-semialdehyde dehydrogenase|nr:glutamate-5-semialdehyde dehydrogenase [Desulfovibrio sp.]
MSGKETGEETGTVDLQAMGRAAEEASRVLASLSSGCRNRIMTTLADALDEHAADILKANALDIAEAHASGMSGSLTDRLLLNKERLAGIAADVRVLATLPDPVGEIMDGRRLDSGLSLMRRRVPLGVVAAVYEARPNVTADVSALCLKTGNAVILRGGKETFNSNRALVRVIGACLEKLNLPPAAVQYINSTDRSVVAELLRLDAWVDMLIPRGGAELHRLCRENSRIPIMTGGIGVCHIFTDKSADTEKSLKVIENAKIQRPSACNALETLLVHKDAAASFLPRLAAHMAPFGCILHLSPEAAAFLPEPRGIETFPVQEGDYDREWLSKDFNVHVVEDLAAALEHIRRHGTGHSEAVLTEDTAVARRFVDETDASALYVNASTRFTDGGQFGLGAEVAISTQKLHARGPMGLESLTTYKWIAYGNYAIRN